MRVIEISNKVYLIRHWFVWYKVERGAARWTKLDLILKRQTPLYAKQSESDDSSIEKSLDSLKKAGKVTTSKPPIDI